MSDERVNEPGYEEKSSSGAGSSENTNNTGSYGQYSYNPYGQQGYQQGGYRGGYQNSAPRQEYHWSFEDYEAAGRRGGPNQRPPRRNSGLAVIGTLLAAIMLVGVICLAGYGIYSLWNGGENDIVAPSSQAENGQPGSSAVVPGLTIKEHPENNDTPVSSTGKLTTVEIAKRVRPSVVGIAQYSNTDTFSPSGEGSGIILNSDGYIITNAHVVSGAAGISVELDSGETYSAKLIGIDSKTDLAVIKIEAANLVAAEFGNSSALQVGETVVAIGNPGGSTLAGSVTQGIVSAVNRTIKEDGYTSNFIQTDAAINPGNSGGALVNEYGQVIGINSSKIAAVDYEGIGFAIPISEAKPVVDDLMAYGYVKGRTKIGISGTEISEVLSQINSIPMGIYISYVDPTSDLAGKNVTKGDIITHIDGKKIYTFDDVSDVLKTKYPGDTIVLTLYRSARGQIDTGKTFDISVKLLEDIEKTAR